MSDLPRFNVMLLNDDKTPMEFVVLVLERFFDMPNVEATTHMYRVHNEGVAICGTYRREEAEKKVADVLAFAGAHKHSLKCVLEQAG
jgi:ATP-dependent Clp protease adaptor protein ClpS